MLREKETRVQGQGGQKYLEAMGIEPETREEGSRLTTNSTVLTVLRRTVMCLLTGENGRFWRNGSWDSRKIFQKTRVCGFEHGMLW